MKLDLIKTLAISAIMLLIALLMNALPALILITAPFLLIPGVYLYYKDKLGFYVMSGIVLIISLVMLKLFALQVIIGVLLSSYLIGQLLETRASKETMLFALTALLSFYTLLSIISMQLLNLLPTTKQWFAAVKDSYMTMVETELSKDNISWENIALFNSALDQMQLQVPGLIVLLIFLLSLVSLLIALPLLRSFKIATPNFRPLYFWRVPKIALYIYVIAVVIKLFLTPEDVVLLGIVTNLQYVLEWIIFIQGISLISFYVKVKRTPLIINLLMFIFAFIMAPITQLLGMLDLIINLKARIKL
ncbi:DUF2232 domain-containing protein [Macrococcus equipercicus]|uniref:DUF2232 domain-containing protein n=2 Tax=Macrococcus equipercicus TaxID=69967 RepID=A0ABQ6R8Q0_9STAP|nr:DUF2232 domain-containing protein [Macrococcus equipercicus]